MRAMRTFCRTLLPVLLLALPAAVQAQFTYTTNKGTITITGYTGPGGGVTIPSTITGLPVTDIGSYAFEYSSLTSVTMGTNLLRIGEAAFYGCASLGSVTIPNSVMPLLGPPLRRSRPPTRKSISRPPLLHSSGPANQRALASGSDQAANTRAGEAS